MLICVNAPSGTQRGSTASPTASGSPVASPVAAAPVAAAPVAAAPGAGSSAASSCEKLGAPATAGCNMPALSASTAANLEHEWERRMGTVRTTDTHLARESAEVVSSARTAAAACAQPPPRPESAQSRPGSNCKGTMPQSNATLT
ncbi:hypothetical protein T492DRAFT_833768 [Pavlovales sp. CCMP2436]|nr:hypothetical protein T492DRAFT_833768 [Pavlovales sp. CCMP2436]